MATLYAKTTEEWRQTPRLISEKNALYIYSDRDVETDPVSGQDINVPGIKVGDGTTYLIDLPFVDDIIREHIRNTDIHITPQERDFWNNKNRGFVEDGTQTLTLTIN